MEPEILGMGEHYSSIIVDVVGLGDFLFDGVTIIRKADAMGAHLVEAEQRMCAPVDDEITWLA